MGDIILHNTNKEINKGQGDKGEDGGRGERGTGIETAITQLRENKESMRLDPGGKEEDLENIPEIHSNLQKKEINESMDLMVVEVSGVELEGKKGAVRDGLDMGSKVIDQKSSLRTSLADCRNSMKQLKELGGDHSEGR